MSDLPHGWEWTTLGEIANSVRNGIFVSRAGREPDGVPILRISSVRPLNLNVEDIRYSGISEQELSENDSLVSPGDLLFTRYSGTADYVGVCATVPDSTKSITYPDKLIRVRLNSHIVSPPYVALAFASPRVREHVTSVLRTTAGQVGISGSALKQVPIPIAPLSEQHRIVSFLEDHISRLDTATRTIQQVASKARLLAQSTFTAQMKGCTASQRTLGELLREPLINGRSVPTHAGGFPVLRLTALREGTIDLQERKEGAWTEANALPFLVKRGDFLVSRGNGSLTLVGRGGIVVDEPDGVAFPDTMIRIRPDKNQIIPKYLEMAWNSRGVRRQIESAARTTAGIYKINQSILNKIEIQLPSITEQAEIVARMEEIRGYISRVLSTAERALAQQRSLRRSLLSEAFDGRLTPRDPRDEPASILLEKVGDIPPSQNRSKQMQRSSKNPNPTQESLL